MELIIKEINKRVDNAFWPLRYKELNFYSFELAILNGYNYS